VSVLVLFPVVKRSFGWRQRAPRPGSAPRQLLQPSPVRSWRRQGIWFCSNAWTRIALALHHAAGVYRMQPAADREGSRRSRPRHEPCHRSRASASGRTIAHRSTAPRPASKPWRRNLNVSFTSGVSGGDRRRGARAALPSFHADIGCTDLHLRLAI